MDRENLNRAALKWGLVLTDSMSDENAITSILTQQQNYIDKMADTELEKISNPSALPPGLRERYDQRMEYVEKNKKLGNLTKAEREAILKEKVQEPEPEPVPDAMGKPTLKEIIAESEARGRERVWVRIAPGSTPGEKGPVFAAHNGFSIRIHRGKWVKLQRRFLSVFADAIITEVELDDDQEKIERDVPRLNIMVRTLEQGIPQERSDSLSMF